MMRSLYSGISGLKNHQTRMDVIGNNIANVNTIGFKTSRVVFQDVFSQTLRTGSAGTTPAEDGTGGMGGTNPAQIGLGVKLGSIDVIHTSAPTQRTDNPLDLAIDGDGYFIVQNPQTGTNYYSRAGNFRLDDKGNLVTSDGFFVMGYDVEPIMGSRITKVEALDADGNPVTDADGNPVYIDLKTPVDPADTDALDAAIKELIAAGAYKNVDTSLYADADELAGMINSAPPEDIQIGTNTDTESGLTQINLAGYTSIAVDYDGTIYGIVDEIRVPIATLSLAMFANPSGLEKAGSSLYRKSGASGEPVETLPQGDGSGSINGGGLEMSNVDLSSEFTDMIVTQRGYQANSRIITVSDSMLEELVNLKR